jgi:hypothetical protein
LDKPTFIVETKVITFVVTCTDGHVCFDREHLTKEGSNCDFQSCVASPDIGVSQYNSVLSIIPLSFCSSVLYVLFRDLANKKTYQTILFCFPSKTKNIQLTLDVEPLKWQGSTCIQTHATNDAKTKHSEIPIRNKAKNKLCLN